MYLTKISQIEVYFIDKNKHFIDAPYIRQFKRAIRQLVGQSILFYLLFGIKKVPKFLNKTYYASINNFLDTDLCHRNHRLSHLSIA
ncbi:MAG: hypothetical protein Tsb004_13970 [Allomuricauda sp.]